MKLADLEKELRRPFTPDAIKWKVQSTWPKDGKKTGGMVVAYIDARLVIERLMHVAPGEWSDHTEPVPGNPHAMICRLTVCGETRSDVGESTHSLKGAASDALKRAGVHFGIGASIYAMNRVVLNATPNGAMQGDPARPTLKAVSKGRKETAELTDQAEDWLRETYGKWLKKVDFGEPLDHGDTRDTLGIEGADTPRMPEDDDPEAEAAQLELQKLWDDLPSAKKRGKWSKARFEAQVRAAVDAGDAAIVALRAEIEGLTE